MSGGAGRRRIIRRQAWNVEWEAPVSGVSDAEKCAGEKEGEQEEDVFVIMKGQGLNEGSC